MRPSENITQLEGYMDDFETRRLEELEAERRTAKRAGRPYAMPCDFPLEWCTGAPMPTLLSSENRTFLIFYLDGLEGKHRVGRTEFKGVWSVKFGEPDENAIMRHSLIGSGFDGFSPMRVVGSPWVSEILRMATSRGFNSKAFSGEHLISRPNF